MTVRSVLGAIYRTLGSLKLSVAILIGWFAATYLGTWAQIDIGLFRAQRIYFESIYYTLPREPYFGWLGVPMPGGYLLMALLVVNLLIGGIIRLRKTWSRAGILIMHFGVVFLMLAGWAKFAFSQEGYVSFYPNESRGVYTSYHDFELSIAEVGPEGATREWVVPDVELAHAAGENTVTVHVVGLPFEVRLSGFVRNANVMPKGPMFSAPTPVVDGYFVQPEDASTEAEMDMAACYATVLPVGDAPQKGILWAGAMDFRTEERKPWTVHVAGRTFLLDLAKRRWPLDFDVELKQFTFERLPNSMKPKRFQSDVVVRAPGQPDLPAMIRMNEPLRRNGVTLYQSSYGPKNAQPGSRMFSVLSVVKNPSDQWPLWSLVVMTLGMAIHFLAKLARWIARETAATKPAEAR
ncbi:MAG: cytochrome c biogenesis protein ResB [Planctomycetota bacterium]